MGDWYEIICLSLLALGLVLGYIVGRTCKAITENNGEAQIRRSLAKYASFINYLEQIGISFIIKIYLRNGSSLMVMPNKFSDLLYKVLHFRKGFAAIYFLF